LTPLVSVIVPVYREPLAIGWCLARLAGCREIERCEVIVSEGDDGASMTPTDLLPVRVVRGRPGRGAQLNAGAAVASADRLLFLHVDTALPRGFVRLVTEALDRRVAGAFDLSISSSHPFVRAVGAVGLVRSRLTRLPYGDQAHFIRRTTFQRAGGYAEFPIMEDVELMRRLRAADDRICILRPPAITSARRWEEEGPLRTTLRNWRIMLAYKAGRSPEALRARYRPQAELEDGSDRLVVFHRALRMGGVKTRLAAGVGAAGALELYRAMLDDTVAVTRLRGVRRHFFVDSLTDGVDHPGESIPQIGRDLWDRMDDAMRRVIAAGAHRVVLVGSDIPGLSAPILRAAFRELDRTPVVLGPSTDGGFYLIGVRAPAYTPVLFDRARRTPDRSAELVERACSERGLRVTRLARLADVDTTDELERVLADPSVRAPRLRAAAKRIGRRAGRSSLY